MSVFEYARREEALERNEEHRDRVAGLEYEEGLSPDRLMDILDYSYDEPDDPDAYSWNVHEAK